MSSSMRPQFFCTRPNGTLTPLIAVDELPPHISIRGAPRTLSSNETQGMTSLGTVGSRPQSYVVESTTAVATRTSPTSANGHRSRDFDLQNALLRLASDETVPASQRLAVNNMLQHGAPQNWTMNNPTSSNWLVPSGNGGSSGGGLRQGNPLTKKEFCSYWIRHGECDYQQQGCLYKHEMPRDLATLEKLGLRDIPRWFREKYNIPSLIPGGGHGHPRAQAGSHGQHWKEDVPDRTGVKSIQYPSHLDLNGAVDTSDVEKGPKQKSPSYTTSQQSSMVVPAPRSGFSTSNSPKVTSHQKQSGKHGSQYTSAAKRHDLLTFEPLPEYPSLNAMGPGVGALTYPTARDDPESLDRAQHEDFIRNMQALMPNPEFLPNPFDVTSGQNRSRKAQRSRRLYQPRPQLTGPEARFDSPDYDTYKNINPLVAAGPSGTSSLPKDSTGSQFASSITGPATEAPNRGVSPSAHSSSSSHVSERSPKVIQPQAGDKDHGLMPSPIGSKRAQQKKPMISTDFFKLNTGHGK
ncbi:hypothetical protein P170DRAFT_508491 [Aspergillus steynii IBT 23096]|uniref:C3H1-type domain-containing protein n=1 Tax=Aspergillus steynii IBT 23096 TaxID=1392250 RepID=A0A2I2GBR7_9EURO|nr:uncharacterized protein P170DRAFT_508491 [Aspergillus steynii IBT 23096]PLB50287.1 hypothetical protein P170DRAFT_508491 [Aspergillus steynii IBT 23096]